MRRLTKKILSAVLAGAMVLSMGVSAFAADEIEAAPLDQAQMTKELKVADGIDISKVNTFTFSFTKGSSDTAAEADHPTIADQTITVGEIASGKATGLKKLSEIFKIGDFKHAGEYVYTVKETTEAIKDKKEGDVTKNLEVDSTEFSVHVFVTNKEDGTGLEFNGVIVKKGDDKVDPTKEPTATDGFGFKNTYKEEIDNPEKAALTVTKKITGALADKTKTFPITVELTLPATATAADVALKDGSTATLNGTTATANLADGGKIEFAKLPAGTTFVVKEDQDAAYKSKTTGFVKTEDTALVEGDVEKEGKEPMTAAGNAVTIENNREDVIPTGVIINNLPYMLMVAIAVAGVAYMQLKKRI